MTADGGIGTRAVFVHKLTTIAPNPPYFGSNRRRPRGAKNGSTMRVSGLQHAT